MKSYFFESMAALISAALPSVFDLVYFLDRLVLSLWTCSFLSSLSSVVSPQRTFRRCSSNFIRRNRLSLLAWSLFWKNDLKLKWNWAVFENPFFILSTIWDRLFLTENFQNEGVKIELTRAAPSSESKALSFCLSNGESIKTDFFVSCNGAVEFCWNRTKILILIFWRISFFLEYFTQIHSESLKSTWQKGTTSQDF